MKIIEEMNKTHLSVKGIYGYRRMILNLKSRFGRNVNAKRVRRLMHVSGIHCIIRRKRPLYIRNHPESVPCFIVIEGSNICRMRSVT